MPRGNAMATPDTICPAVKKAATVYAAELPIPPPVCAISALISLTIVFNVDSSELGSAFVINGIFVIA
jgi:hypothetical protein